jgi:integrase
LSQRKHVVKLPELITNVDFGLLLRAVNQAATYHHVRSRAITLLYLGFYGGLRHSEALHLVASDINFPDRKFRITAKADVGFSPKNWEERPIPLARPLEQTLKSHLATLPLRPPSSGSADGSNYEWLFPVYKGLRVILEPTSLATSVDTMRNVFRKAGFEPGMHRLRKSFATRLLNGGGNSAEMDAPIRWMPRDRQRTCARVASRLLPPRYAGYGTDRGEAAIAAQRVAFGLANAGIALVSPLTLARRCLP